MTADEWPEVVAALTASFPAREITGPEWAVWFDTLGRLDARAVLEAVREVRDNQTGEPWPPSYGTVLKAAQAVARRLALAQPALPVDTGPPTPPEAGLAHIAELRERLHGKRSDR